MKTWIDLTDFLQWTGNLTGIQRIQYNLSKQYINSVRDVGFFVYDEPTRSFREVSFNPDEIVESGIIINRTEERVRRTSKAISAISRIRIKRQQRVDEEHVSCPFSEGDTIAVLGGIWVGTFIDDLITCKRNHNLKFIHFAFDMIPTLFPGYVVDWLPKAFGEYQEKVFAHADGIIAISESTANDVRDFIKERDIKNHPKIMVTRIAEGINTDTQNVDGTTAIEELKDEKFILSVSTIEGRKNHAALFYAVKEAERRNIQLPKIVIVGRNGWLTDDIRYTIQNDLESKDRMLILNDINDSSLTWLYKNCLFTVFPSFYEGWGMPIAESLAYGKLCISSNTSSMPEIAGDLIDYFSPYNTGQLLDRIIENLDDKTRVAKESKIAKQYKVTSWKEMFDGIDSYIDNLSAQ